MAIPKTTVPFLVLLLAGLTIPTHANTFDSSSITTEIYSFGNPNTATYGQTFTAPNAGGDVLNSWTFYLENAGGSNQNFQFFVMAWNGAEATGPVLYQSATQTILASQTNNTAFTVDPGLSLTAGDSYVMFINESGLNTNYGAIGEGGNSTSPLGGDFVYLNNGDDFSEVTSSPWNIYNVADTSYVADFSDIPPPTGSVPDGGSTLAMLGLAMTGLACVRRKLGLSLAARPCRA